VYGIGSVTRPFPREGSKDKLHRIKQSDHAQRSKIKTVKSKMTRPRGSYAGRPSWVRLYRLRTGVGLLRSTMPKWGLVPSANCRCGAEEQTADHIASCRPLYHPLNGILVLAALDDDTMDWLKKTY